MPIFYFLIFQFLYYKGLIYISILLTNHFCFWKKYWPIHLDYVFFHKNRRIIYYYYLEAPKWWPWIWTFQDIGEIYQQEQDLENAAVYLNRAADLFDSEGQSSQANSITQKIAEIYAQLEK